MYSLATKGNKIEHNVHRENVLSWSTRIVELRFEWLKTEQAAEHQIDHYDIYKCFLDTTWSKKILNKLWKMTIRQI